MRNDVFIDSEILLMIDFVNLKIKPTQSFKNAHRGNAYVCVHRSEYSYMYKFILCLKKISNQVF
jgi:hypothetical protein